MLATDIGDGSTACPPVTVLAVPMGSTVTVNNLAASTASVTYSTNFDTASSGTIAANASQAFTNPAGASGPVLLSVVGGRASIQVTGGSY